VYEKKDPSDTLILRPSETRSKNLHEVAGHGDASGLRTHARRDGARRDGATTPRHEILLHVWPKPRTTRDIHVLVLKLSSSPHYLKEWIYWYLDKMRRYGVGNYVIH
jgi:hypothetical protein